MVLRSDDPQPVTGEPRKRRVPIRALLLLALAVVTAVAAAALLTRYMDARLAAARVPTSKVVVAAVDIPVAQPLELHWLRAVDWPAAVRPEGAATEPAALVGKVATVPISQGEPVLPGKLVTSGARSGLPTLIREGMRAVAVRVDEVVGVAGFVHPGDRVDVIVTMKPREDVPFVSRIVLQNVQVVAVGKELDLRGKDAKEAKPVTVATLMVTAEESERLALSADRGHLLLALRGIGDEERAETHGVTAPVVMLTNPPEPTAPQRAVAVRPPRRQKPAPPPAAPPLLAPAVKEDRQVVEVIRGDLYEKRAFTERKETRP